MGADEEIGERRRPRSAAPAILQKHLTGQKRGFERDRFADESVSWKSCVQVFDAREVNRHFAVDDRVDDQPGGFGRRGQRRGRPIRPIRILGKDVEDHAAIDQNGGHSPRVRAMISSVVMVPSPRPRICATKRAPRPLPVWRRARLMWTALPSKSNSTSVFGSRPAFSRMARGMVTWPLDVMRMESNPILLLLVRVRPNCSTVKD